MFYSKVYTKIGDMLLMPIIYDCVAIYNCILVLAYCPFLLTGKISVILFILCLVCLINASIFNKKEYKELMFYSLFIGLIWVLISFMASKPMNTEYYEPRSIIRNDNQIILIGKQHTVIDTTLRLYNSKHPYICKNLIYNGYNMHTSDTWYACEK